MCRVARSGERPVVGAVLGIGERASAVAERGDDGSGDDTVRIGLVAEPALSTTVVNGLAGELPDALGRNVTSGVSWEVDVASEMLPLDTAGDIALVDFAGERMPREGWDLMVCLTDLPGHVYRRPVVGDFSVAWGAGQISLPAMGWRLRRNVRDTVVHMVGAMVGRLLGVDHAAQEAAQRSPSPLRGPLSSVRHAPGAREDIDAKLVLVGLRGKARLLFGMVRANRPWLIVPGLSSVTAAAAGGGAFGIFFSNVWSLSDALSYARLAVINVFVVAAMILWIIIHNNLWERPSEHYPRPQAALYNAVTLVTLLVGVASMYVLLFALILLGAVAVISGDYLGTTLGHPVGIPDYLVLTWLASSLGTLAGALGSGLENETAIRRAVYSTGEQQRRTRHREEAADSGEG